MIADGTRREDRIPKLKFSEIQSLEDRKNIQYLNLTGIGYKTINDTSERLFKLQKGESNIHNSSDYEMEIRVLLKEKGYDPETVQAVDWKAYKEEQYDKLADIVRASLDMKEIYRIIGL